MVFLFVLVLWSRVHSQWTWISCLPHFLGFFTFLDCRDFTGEFSISLHFNSSANIEWDHLSHKKKSYSVFLTELTTKVEVSLYHKSLSHTFKKRHLIQLTLCFTETIAKRVQNEMAYENSDNKRQGKNWITFFRFIKRFHRKHRSLIFWDLISVSYDPRTKSPKDLIMDLTVTVVDDLTCIQFAKTWHAGCDRNSRAVLELSLQWDRSDNNNHERTDGKMNESRDRMTLPNDVSTKMERKYEKGPIAYEPITSSYVRQIKYRFKWVLFLGSRAGSKNSVPLSDLLAEGKGMTG